MRVPDSRRQLDPGAHRQRVESARALPGVAPTSPGGQASRELPSGLARGLALIVSSPTPRAVPDSSPCLSSEYRGEGLVAWRYSRSSGCRAASAQRLFARDTKDDSAPRLCRDGASDTPPLAPPPLPHRCRSLSRRRGLNLGHYEDLRTRTGKSMPRGRSLAPYDRRSSSSPDIRKAAWWGQAWTQLTVSCGPTTSWHRSHVVACCCTTR